jgi:hypothetical protein
VGRRRRDGFQGLWQVPIRRDGALKVQTPPSANERVQHHRADETGEPWVLGVVLHGWDGSMSIGRRLAASSEHFRCVKLYRTVSHTSIQLYKIVAWCCVHTASHVDMNINFFVMHRWACPELGTETK